MSKFWCDECELWIDPNAVVWSDRADGGSEPHCPGCGNVLEVSDGDDADGDTSDEEDAD